MHTHHADMHNTGYCDVCTCKHNNKCERAHFTRTLTLTCSLCACTGNFGVPEPRDLGLPDGAFFDTLFHDRQIKLLKGGIELADRVVTVSPSYKEEIITPEGGFGLHDVCRGRMMQLDGVLNGIVVRSMCESRLCGSVCACTS